MLKLEGRKDRRVLNFGYDVIMVIMILQKVVFCSGLFKIRFIDS